MNNKSLRKCFKLWKGGGGDGGDLLNGTEISTLHLSTSLYINLTNWYNEKILQMLIYFYRISTRIFNSTQ